MATVPWRTLRHANGPATRVPDQIKRLAGKPRSPRESAFLLLLDSFRRRGEWFSASAPTLAALLDVAGSSHRPDLVLAVAADVLTSDHVGAWAGPWEVSPSGYAIDAREQALRSGPGLLKLVGSPEPRARAGAALVLAFATESAESSRTALLARLSSEEDPAVRQSLLLALVALGPDARVLQALGESLTHGDPVVRGAAAVGRLRLDPTLPFEALAEPILAWLSWRPDPDTKDTIAPWFGGSVLGFEEEIAIPSPASAALVAVAQSQGRLPALADALVEMAETTEDSRVARRIGETLLHLGSFPSDKAYVALPSELTPIQRHVAERIAESMLVPLAGRGLPACGEARSRWLGKSQPGPLNEEVGIELSGTVEAVPKWRAWCALPRTEGYMPASVAAGMTAVQRWSSLVEFMAATYSITVALNDAQVAAEVELVPKDAEFFVLAARMADDLGRRFDAARREGRDVYSRPDLSALLFLPSVRSGRPLEERWAPVVFMGPGDGVFAALPEPARERIVLERVPLRSGAAGLGVSAALTVLHLIPSRRVLEHLRNAIARVEKMKPEAAGKYRDELFSVARAHAEVGRKLAETADPSP